MFIRKSLKWFTAALVLAGFILSSPAANTRAAEVPLDFNGDGRTDYAIARNMNGEFMRWYIIHSGVRGSNVAIDFGSDWNKLVPADYDGDGKTDLALWYGEGTPQFYILNSLTNTVKIEIFGLKGDDPTVVGDYDGDGKADVAVFRRGTTQSVWYYRGSFNNPDGAISNVIWGKGSDDPYPGDIDGDGRYDFTVRRPASNQSANFWTRFATGTEADIITFGKSTDKLVPGDYDGDGALDLAVTRKVGYDSLQWYWRSSLTGTVQSPVTFGIHSTDSEVQGDYDGDGKTDFAVFRINWSGHPNKFWVKNSSNATTTIIQWGIYGDYVVGGFMNQN